ncbi:MAG: ABC transporter permease subunit [Crenarchaeota archaeon]|nr:ABC transporter permease subunit [Thermoproteota archaeon]
MEPIQNIVLRSLTISGTATLLAALWSLPLAYLLASSRRFRPLVYFFEALVGIPTVLVGLLLYLLLSRNGPLGFLELLYTPQAIIIGEALLITPLITAVSYQVMLTGLSYYRELALTLGASDRQAALLVFRETLPSLISSVVMGFSRAVGELGVALIVGGNIKGYTRTMTTSIALATAMGEYEAAVKLGLVLTAIAVGVSLVVRLVRREWASE